MEAIMPDSSRIPLSRKLWKVRPQDLAHWDLQSHWKKFGVLNPEQHGEQNILKSNIFFRLIQNNYLCTPVLNK